MCLRAPSCSTARMSNAHICIVMHLSDNLAAVNSQNDFATSAGHAVPETQDTPGVIALPPLIYLAGFCIGVVLELLLPSASLPTWLALGVGVTVLAAGLALAAAFFAAFRRAGTPVDVYKPSTTVVTTGPYRLTRNPGYLSLALIYVGLTILFSAPWVLVPLAVVLLVVDRGVIQREERYMAQKFGGDYLRYKTQTRRWL